MEELAASPYVLINRMYSRNVLNKVTDADEPTWKISASTAASPTMRNLSTMSSAVWGEPTEALYDWQTRFIRSIYLPQVKGQVAGGVYVHNQTYLTLEEFDKIIDGHHGSIHLVPCNCKSPTTASSMYCVNMNDRPNSRLSQHKASPSALRDMKRRCASSTPADSCRTARTASSATATVCAASMQMAYKRRLPPDLSQIQLEDRLARGRVRQLRQVHEDLQLGAFYKGQQPQGALRCDKCWGCTICAPGARSTLSTCCRESRRPERKHFRALRNSIWPDGTKSGRPAFFLALRGNGERKSAPWHLSKFWYLCGDPHPAQQTPALYLVMIFGSSLMIVMFRLPPPRRADGAAHAHGWDVWSVNLRYVISVLVYEL